MAEDTAAGGSKTASPAKSGWVNFDEDAADGGGGGRVNGETLATAKGSSPSSPSTGPTSSGVSSARGSVNSISRSNYDQSSPGALQVSEIQVGARVDIRHLILEAICRLGLLIKKRKEIFIPPPTVLHPTSLYSMLELHERVFSDVAPPRQPSPILSCT